MTTNQELNAIIDELLDIARNADEIDNSDLQGCIEAQARKAYELGKKDATDYELPF
jgi:hypothetical protein